MRMKALLILSIVLLSGCAGSQWVRVSADKNLHKGDGYQLRLPDGWIKLQSGDTLLVTRDGPGLQRILVRMAKHEDAFRHLKKPSAVKQLPSELADLFLANMRKEDADEIPSLEVLSNEPARVAGHDAFRLHVSYRTGRGLRYQAVIYGFVTDDHFVSIGFIAPSLHYFGQDRDKIEAVVNSLKLS